MKISLIIPPNNFLSRLAPEFYSLGHDVVVNHVTSDCDVILGMSISQLVSIERFHQKCPEIPLITYNWDWYDHIDKTVGDWKVFTDLMRESKEVWSASEITAAKCRRDTKIESTQYFYAYILPEEWEGEKKDGGYIIQASRRDDYKRFDWFEKAATELKIPFRSYHPGVNARPDYIDAVKNCSVLVASSTEDSIGGLTLMEAAYCDKPILVGDHPGAKEVWGDAANYFMVNDFEDYKKKMQLVWDSHTDLQVKRQEAKKKVEENFLPHIVARKMSERLHKIL